MTVDDCFWLTLIILSTLQAHYHFQTQQSPAQRHNIVQFRLFLLHFHRLSLQPFLQEQWISSAWLRVVQRGVHLCCSAEWPSIGCVVSFCQPQSAGFGVSGADSRHFPQMCPPWYVARRICCLSAACVGGMFSMERPRLENKACLCMFTSLVRLVRSYIRTTKR